MTVPDHCPHCGQLNTVTGSHTAQRTAHWVEQDVLDCFNVAFAEAAWRAAHHVDLVHLLLAICRNLNGRTVLEECDVDVTVLTAVIASELPPLLDEQSATTRPRTSDELTHLLDVTRQTVALHGSRYISLRHLVGTLLNPPRSLANSAHILRWFWAARRYPGPTTPRRPSLERHGEAGAMHAHEHFDQRALLARLERQEHLLEAVLKATRPPAPPPRSSDEDRLPPLANDNAEAQRAAAASAHAHQAQLQNNVVPLDDTPDFEGTDAGPEPDPELEKLGVRRYYLSLDDEIVRAPSIGPRTAARLQPHGITHVKHLLSCEPERLSVRLGVRHITASRIVAWKNQARLVCTIPWLRGTHAQLLVGAGYSSIERILSTDRSTVCAAVMQFATTKDGQSILRAGPPPEIDRIMRWIENSQQAEPQRALTTRAQMN